MTSNLLLLLIFIIIIIVVGFFSYQCSVSQSQSQAQSQPQSESYASTSNLNSTTANTSIPKPQIQPALDLDLDFDLGDCPRRPSTKYTKYTKSTKSTKSVRFNDRVECRTYRNPSPLCSCSCSESEPSPNSNPSPNPTWTKPSIDSDSNSSWDSSFGPLLEPNAKDAFTAKLKAAHENYTRALSEFSSHMTDDQTLIKTDVSIDRWASVPTPSNTIRSIYDAQVAGPRARPKRIVGVKDDVVQYEAEREINSGIISGSNSNLRAWNSNCSYQSAEFGSGF